MAVSAFTDEFALEAVQHAFYHDLELLILFLFAFFFLGGRLFDWICLIETLAPREVLNYKRWNDAYDCVQDSIIRWQRWYHGP